MRKHFKVGIWEATISKTESLLSDFVTHDVQFSKRTHRLYVPVVPGKESEYYVYSSKAGVTRKIFEM